MRLGAVPAVLDCEAVLSVRVRVVGDRNGGERLVCVP
jgi:hypothetical protein